MLHNIDETKKENKTKESSLKVPPLASEGLLNLSQHTMLTADQLREREEWGKSKDGYVAGGNYDDDPNLKKFTIKSY